MSAADELRPFAKSAPLEPNPLVDRLLMSGLDEYFEGRYERAIQVWSRVFFLDRSHPRARAYIDRARSALAEAQREAEARGGRPIDSEVEPRSLIGSFGADSAKALAADPSVTVHGALAALPRRSGSRTPAAAAPAAMPIRRRRLSRKVGHAVLVVVSGVLLFGAGYTVAARDRLAQWWRAARLDGTATPSRLTTALGVRTSEEVLGHVRQLLERGRFDEALVSLSMIAQDDPRRPEADRLREEVRRAVATGAAPTVRPPGGRPGAGGPESR
jgi:hypothetical protein